MNSIKKHLALGLFYAAAVLYVGCLPEEDLKWSDDGKVGLLNVEDGLYLVDGESGELKQIAEGKVEPWPDISGDGKTIVYCQMKTVSEFGEGLALLDAGEVKMVEGYAAKAAKAIVERGGIEGMEEAEKRVLSSDDFGKWVARYICEKGPEDALVILGQEWTDRTKEVDLPYYEIIIADAGGTDRKVVTRSVFQMADLRLSPGAENVAYVAADPERGQDDDIDIFNLFAASVGGSIKKMLVGDRVAILGHDWRQDGRAIAYVSAHRADYTGDELPVLGTLLERVVTDDSGALLAGGEARLGSVGCSTQAKELAGTLFFPFARVQYGPAGRIFFASADFRLPMVKNDEPQWSVYCYDAALKTVANVLPQKVISETSGFDNLSPALFSLSPDGRKVLLVMENNRLAVYEPGAGLESLRIPLKADEGFEDGLQFLPAWKGGSEVSFLVSDKSHFDIGDKETAIGVLDEQGGFSVLSKEWPELELPK